MRALFVTSEAYPLVKTGGLGDVAGVLPAALRAAGVDARILLPAYPAVLAALELEPATRELELLPGAPPARVLTGVMPDGETPLYALQCDALYARDGGPYHDRSGADWADNDRRFATLSRLASLMATASSPIDWRPGVLHLNDWQSGLAAAYLAFSPHERSRVVTSIHNIAYQGLFAPDRIPALGLPWAGFSMHGFEFHGRLSFLKAGIYYADHVTTVSPRYAQEICTETFGMGLHGLLRTLGPRLTGILNGIDEVHWNPATDSHLAAHYDAAALAGKAENKAALQRELGLAESAGVPLLGLIGRLTHQKGVDLVPPALQRLGERQWQLAVLGTGAAALERALENVAREAPQRVAYVSAFDEGLAHRIEAGADLFLMPSRFEPCGLNQMYSMRYATPPVVHATGGLADTVVDASPKALREGNATGFTFQPADAGALALALDRALELFEDREAWRRIQRAGMNRDFSWSHSAAQYRALYERLAAAPAG